MQHLTLPVVVSLVVPLVSAMLYVAWTLGELTTNVDTLNATMGTVQMEIRLLNDKLDGIHVIARSPQ